VKARQEAGGRRQEENSSIIKRGFGMIPQIPVHTGDFFFEIVLRKSR
jgi:hypothetical protein